MESLSPKSLEQSDKSKKYDRQLRLWGDHGQLSLESANVCLINATAVGTEILKSLVLPGIGSFTIVDNHEINESDLDSNFFLDHENIGKSRAQIAVQFLLELNSDVHGDYLDDTVENILQNDPNYFNNFTIVVATSLFEREVIRLSEKLWDLNIPFITCRSYGLVAGARMQLQEHTIIETHPDNQTPDLRLDCPFEELKQYFDSYNLEQMDLKDHAHVPYVIVLYKYIEEFKKIYSKYPKTYEHKEMLKELIRKGIKKDENGVQLHEENFEEALKAVNYATLSSAAIPQAVTNILSNKNCINITTKSRPFWIMANALKDFIEQDNDNLLPLRGTLPDMTAETKQYITLQQIYRNKASSDADIVYKRVQSLLHRINQPTDTISEEEVRLFCKCCSSLHVMYGSRISDEYRSQQINASYIASQLEDPESMIEYYMMLRSIERYYTEYKEYPGILDDHVEPDIIKLKACVSKLLMDIGCGTCVITDDVIHEFCRYGGGELHSISAFIGGCIAHEIIKLITHQYKPFNNAFIYSAITSSVAVFEL